MKQKRILKVAIIGLGAIGRTVANHIDNGNEKGAELVSLLCRDKQKHIALSGNQSAHFQSIITDNSEEFFESKPDIVIEGRRTRNFKIIWCTGINKRN
ncbi:hypothetical protein ACLKMH_14680 [Psychromonas sp. KJ10-10]|uniref:hypothetical protein n=1 Tax=Psychromonas sp. KJ10-10 TaxID=3391823 RepID=UPI0039B4438E